MNSFIILKDKPFQNSRWLENENVINWVMAMVKEI